MATLHKNKNVLQKLALPLAVVVTAVYFFGCWYSYFYAASTQTAYYFNTYVKYLLWVVYEVVFLFSFSANNATGFARHVMYYLIAAALCDGGLYYWTDNFFQPDMSKTYWQIAYYFYGSYHLEVFRSITVNAVGLVFFGALFCGVKYNKNSSGWLRKHTH